MAKKKKLLPKGFRSLLRDGDMAAVTAVYDNHELGARDRRGGQSALGLYECPPELMRWLVGQGLDVDFTDQYGRTALSSHVTVDNVEQTETLLDLGADPEAGKAFELAGRFHSPGVFRVLLDRIDDPDEARRQATRTMRDAFASCSNIDLTNTAAIAEIALAVGMEPTPTHTAQVERLGRQFESMREAFAPEGIPAADAALDTLYRLFDVTPVAAHVRHDGTSQIVPQGDDVGDQFEDLWDRLVPPTGAAATVQGEVIRIAGRVGHELFGNGGANWDAGFRAMVDAFASHVRSGNPLPAEELGRVDELSPSLRRGEYDEADLDLLTEWSVAWVSANPTPVPLPEPSYRR